MAGQTGVYRGMSAEQRAAERRQRLLEATLAVWADPATRTTMTAVCAEAGLTERYFYESFRGLDEALLAVLDGVAAEIERVTLAAADAADAAGEEPAGRVHATVRAFVQLLVDDPRKGRVAIIEAAAVPALRQRRTDLLRYLAHRSTEEARTHLGLPSGRGARADEFAGLLFIGGMAELITAWLDGSLEASAEEIVDAAAHCFLGVYG
ncbi:TetR/AcrR family transcriptional regulator [Nocardioides sp. BP30]|uniref:TetR/AcrR family transcriptional regulator n=1 Tax=Nocardioides sp. BP30 TaxID=3036374 RepID=UPI002469B229|nr:TetR/AcrR family transcriptional regulator [Nocardioides sp. BP30]WGL51731.1 TetR/AcrR family transcriptional regulator [Nocardioides sp. BP30]